MIISGPGDYRAAAERRLPRFLFDYIDGGAVTERTMKQNVEELGSINLRQRVLTGAGTPSLETEIMAQKWALPIALGPASLLHGTMAAAMPTALGLQKAQPGRQVISLSGDGGIGMLIGDLMTAVQHKLPIKVAVFNNGKLGFIDIEQKSEGLVPLYTHLENPDFGEVAKAMGLWGRTVAKADELEAAVGEWLAQPGPALLDVNVEPMTLVMPPTIEFGPAYGMVLYSARAVLGGQTHDLIEMIKENI